MIQSIASSLPLAGFSSGNLSRSDAQASKKAASVAGDTGTTTANLAATQTSQLTAEEQQQVQQLKQTDRKVRAHEQAHISVGADLVLGGPTFSYETGPDKQRYAVAGEVSIDTSPARTPEETIPKAQHIRATALAPVDPSAQDHSVAAQAQRMESQARMELAVQRRDEADNAEQGGAGFYRGVVQADARNSLIGGRVNAFA